MSVKAVVFDFGGVMCYLPTPEKLETVALLAGLPPERLRELHGKYRREYDRGVYSGREYYRFILEEAGIFLDDSSLDEIAQADQDCWKNIDPATVQLMRDIKAAGVTLGILSNMPRDFLPWAREHIPIFNEADIALFSCEYNLTKPEAAIYEKLKEKARCEYREIVFFDDLPDNVIKARELGIQGIIWEGPEAAREDLKLELP